MIRLEFKNFPRVVELSSKARPAYYRKDGKVPERILNRIGQFFDWNDEGLLYDLHTKQIILKNAKKVGKPRTISINGNLIWEIPTDEKMAKKKMIEVATIKRFLVNYFVTEIQKMGVVPIKIDRFPVIVNFFYTIHPSHDNPDDDNLRLFYEKSFRDAIQYMYYPINPDEKRTKIDNPIGFVPDDALDYIIGGLSLVFVKNVPETLLITITELNNEILLSTGQKME